MKAAIVLTAHSWQSAPIFLAILAACSVLVFPPNTAGAQAIDMNAGLAAQLRNIEVRVVAGRIRAMGPNSNQSMTSNVTINNRRERLSLNLAAGSPTISYSSLTALEELSIDVEEGAKIALRRAPRSQADRPEVEFVQPLSGLLTLTVTDKGQTQTYHARTLWHLLVVEPQVCQQYLFPLLELLQPRRQLAEQVAAIEMQLQRDVAIAPDGKRSQWQQAVNNLASTHYVDRERAEEQLQGAGREVLPFLQQAASRAQLDPEQAFRMRRIVRHLTGAGDEDTPERVAMSLSDDPRIWIALAERDNVSQRRAAAQHLGALFGGPVAFDPHATPEQRKAQLAELRDRYASVLDPPQSTEASARSAAETAK